MCDNTSPRDSDWTLGCADADTTELDRGEPYAKFGVPYVKFGEALAVFGQRGE